MNKRKERRNASLKRRRKQFEPYDVVLIVCEGAKTEPQYFNELKNSLRLSHANVRVCGKECGTSPLSVVQYAKQEFVREKKYNRVFCVFDKDDHSTYRSALDSLKHCRGALFEAITSVPCFEFWLLLHFEDTARPYGKVTGSYSACESVIRDLKKYIPDYEKGLKNIFDITYPSISNAIKRATLLEHRQEEIEEDNPSTKVHHLVDYLHSLKKTLV